MSQDSICALKWVDASLEDIIENYINLVKLHESPEIS